MTDDDILSGLRGAIVRKYAGDFGFVMVGDAPGGGESHAWAQPIFGESALGDWSGTLHEPFQGWKATNIHVSDSWVLSILTAQYGKCYRVLDSDIHFFSDRSPSEIQAWMGALPARDATPPARAAIAGYPYGVRQGNPLVEQGDYTGLDHITGRPDCHWYNKFSAPNAGGKSGSPCFSVENGVISKIPFGINVARGYTWEDAANHWGVIQCYNRGMILEAAVS